METRSLVGNDRMDTKSLSLSGSERKGHKRKLADTSFLLSAVEGPNNSLVLDVRAQVDVLKSCLSWRESDRVAARCAAHALAELAKHGEMPLVHFVVYYSMLPASKLLIFLLSDVTS
jgi:hypothetical protein